MKTDETTKVHVVLSAGGSLAISYIGVLGALVDHNISIASVSACSAGSLIGALFCAGKTPEEMEKLVLDIDLSTHIGTKEFPTPLQPLSYTKWPFAIYKQSGIPKLLCKLLQNNPRFKDLKIHFSTGGVDIASNRILVYSSETHPDMLVSEAVRIAIALPLLYKPHEKKGRVVVDLAIASKCPVWLATAHHDEYPILVVKPARRIDVYNPKNIFAYLWNAFSASVESRDDYMMKQIPRVRVIEIDCGHIGEDQYKLSKREKEFMIAQGRTCAEDLISSFGNDWSNINAVPDQSSVGEEEDDIAERYGANLMNRFHKRLSSQVRDQVFISYSHKDRDWLEKLQIHLKPYTRHAAITVWDDTRIKSGAIWRQEIENALAAAKVAILLVSPDFLASDFIIEHELPSLLEAAEKDGLTIFWIPLTHSAYKEAKIGEYQVASGCNPTNPLSSLSENEQNRVFVTICEGVKALMSD